VICGRILSMGDNNPAQNTITSHMQKIIQIHPCLLKLSRKQESVTDAAITISLTVIAGG
jgi:hypothetical protein